MPLPVVPILPAPLSSRVVGQPVDDLALAFVTPLGADDDHVVAAAFLLHVRGSGTRNG